MTAIEQKIKSWINSQDNEVYRMLFDYYNGNHFRLDGRRNRDYDRSSANIAYTRSGLVVFPKYDQTEDVLVKANFCRVIVDTIASYTKGTNEDITITAQDEQHQKVVDSIVGLEKTVLELANKVGIYGNAYLRFRKPDGSDKIYLHVITPDIIRTIDNPVDEAVDEAYYFTELTKEEAARYYGYKGDEKEIYYIEHWTTDNLERYVCGKRYEPEKDLNPYGSVPFEIVKADIYGGSDIKDTIPLNDQLNLYLTYSNETVKWHAFPIYAPDTKEILTADVFKNVTISPKEIVNFPLKRIGSDGIPQTMLDQIEAIKDDIATTSRVPLKLLRADINGDSSGVALERIMSGLMQTVETRRTYIKDALEKTLNKIFKASGIEEQDVEITFSDIIKADTKARVEEAALKQSVGISRKTTVTELGYNYEEEEEQKESELGDLSRINEEINGTEDEQENSQREQEA